MEMKTMPRWARVVALVIAAILLQVTVLHKLQVSGIIDKLIPWDECAYIYMGISNAFLLKNGVWHGLQYAHSPVSILPATLAALFVPQSDAAPYWINFVYLIGLFWFVDWALRKQRYSSAVAFVLVLITTPFVFIFTSHIKADFHGGVLFFILLSVLFQPDDEEEVNFGIPAVLSVLVVMTKPMAFYVPVLLTAVFVLSAFERCVSAGRLDRQSIRRHALLAIVTIGLYALLVLPNLPFFKAYITQALSPTWASGGPFGWKLRYYMPFITPSDVEDNKPYGFWGRNIAAYAIIFLCFAGFVRSLKVWRKAALIACVAVIALIPAVMSPQQQWSFGSLFAAAVVALLFFMMRAIQTTRAASAANWIVIVSSILVFNVTVVQYRSWIQSSPQTTQEAKAITEDFVSKMDPKISGNAPSPSIYFPFSGPVPDFDFGIRYYRKYHTIPMGMVEAFTFDENVINGGLKDYSYVVMLSDNFQLIEFLESNRRRGEFQKRIEERWNLEKLSTLPYANATYSLYRVVSMKN
ncbi:hypothetical protein H3V53_06400 [Paraburkholderia bengalensis]|uniref:Dolichyl-phosphate-mannose-protein mannosyltransferase n=1 Tax=Paraburkholderia bengalensis TaxID=2747562 RepID=A0ABU8IML7_9BURK